MVKNAGGNKTKRGARKHTFAPINKKTRLIEEEGETYATVVKMLGGSNCEVICGDGVTRLCVIRNKFKGRSKRDNLISTGVWILVGIRSWEVRTGAREKCDLLQVYSNEDKEFIKKNTDKKITTFLLSVQEPGQAIPEEFDVVDFVDNSNSEKYENIIVNTSSPTSIEDDDDDDDEIDFDEI
jgi:initiation factor 1A